MIFQASWLTLGMFSAAFAGVATLPQTLPLLTWFSLFLVRSSANFAKKIQELAKDKAENNSVQTPTTNIRSQSFVLRCSLSYRNSPYSKNLGGGTPPRGASMKLI